jgi:hypothetical protein
MVTLHIADDAMAFLSTAPGDKILMDFFLIAGQRNPQIENITQKDKVLVIFFERFKHLKKNCMISFGFANVGIRDDNHLIVHALIGNMYQKTKLKGAKSF